MKRILILILLAIFLFGSKLLISGIREKFYTQRGPKLFEATVLVIRDEINIVRDELELPERTVEQMVAAIINKEATIEDYEIMSQEEPR